MIRVFAGYDDREAIGFHVFVHSLFRHASEPVALTPVTGDQRDGTNAFIYARFLVPAMCEFKGWALFVDGSDMLVRDDVAKLWTMRDERYAVQVVQHDYQTRRANKYRGTVLENRNEHYPRKNWSSVVLWNCEHPANAHLTRTFVRQAGGAYLHRFDWLDANEIGGLPKAWNTLVGEHDHDAALAHFTYGLPCWPQYARDDYADEWRMELQRVMQSGVA